ncbi:UDP-N-acetylmuramate dehydrogenase [Arsenicitalea aurantiaca]|uniref:UDP-N-acetylenolpyruvoylglucosamine reductase n=1 Tax=Arsenicitalea aurantiaca TaxID=1783274 RepID=A0A433XM40_9HYPH|nr:UDP-N-acetylmuramate dehydrogenase [Arsenicitalea aurantiaca]RUT35123.1 UDP-N-acetylmuramate dehydrogenase [Arsenicitalea aurantiaca]
MSFPDLIPQFEPWISEIRGRLIPNQPLSEVTWFRVGGPAQLFFQPADEADLALFLKHLPAEIRVTTIGLGSNLLIRDGGLDGVVIRLSARGFGGVEVLEGHRLRVGTALPDVKVATAAAEAGIDGLTFYRGIPGGIGGALYMNAGCYGTETRDRMVELRAVTRDGEIVTLSNADMAYRYRKSNGPRGAVFTSAVFQGFEGDRDDILARMREITEKRESSQPTKAKTGGSTFKNPEGHSSWKLIDAAGCRGLTVGGAQMSELHANFLLNLGVADAYDIETLGETVRSRVRDTQGISLNWEIRRMGHFLPGREVREFLDGDVFTGAV